MVLFDLVRELRSLPRDKEIKIAFLSKSKLEEVFNERDDGDYLMYSMNYHYDGGLNFVLGDNNKKILSGELLDYIDKNTKDLESAISIDVEDGFVFAFASGFYHYGDYLVVFVE